jgi:hypothetical protein
MTKSWEGIREEACRLYLSGKPLSQVQKQIEAKFGFKAAWVQPWPLIKEDNLTDTTSTGRDPIGYTSNNGV